jgi:hypothetical protein
MELSYLTNAVFTLLWLEDRILVLLSARCRA